MLNIGEGDTVNIPAGTCAWTTGVTISGKGITVQGAGSGRIVAYSSSALTIGTGAKTLTLASDRVDGTYPLGPTPGQTLTLFETGTSTNYMTGTVTSFSGSSLVMNITSLGGSCGANSLSNCKRWLVTTPSSTVIIDNSVTTSLFNVTEDTTYSTNISGIKVAAGSGEAFAYEFFYTSGGKPFLLHDCWVQNGGAPTGPYGAQVEVHMNRGVIWNCSFDSTPPSTYEPSSLNVNGGIWQVDTPGYTNSWTTPSTWGAADKTGTGALYVESNDFHALSWASNADSNARQVFRYNVVDNSEAFEIHGADTSTFGSRYFEFYNNILHFDGFSDGTTFNLNRWVYVRGGTFVIHDNFNHTSYPQDYGTKLTLWT